LAELNEKARQQATAIFQDVRFMAEFSGAFSFESADTPQRDAVAGSG
jgi:hypothetical protein